jgi:DNA-binding MarR family transcriptional regulator
MSSEVTNQPPKAQDVHARDLEDAIGTSVSAALPDVNERALRLGVGLKRAANILVQRTTANNLGTTDRSPAAIRTMVLIWIFRSVEARDLARLSGFTRQAVSAVLTMLERDGLITRERGALRDRRLAPVSITKKGREFVEAVLPLQSVAETRFFSVLTAKEQDQLAELLSKLITGTLDQHGCSE